MNLGAVLREPVTLAVVDAELPVEWPELVRRLGYDRLAIRAPERMHANFNDVPRVIVESSSVETTVARLRTITKVACCAPVFLVGSRARSSHRRLQSYARAGFDGIFMTDVSHDIYEAEATIRRAARLPVASNTFTRTSGSLSLGIVVFEWCRRNSFRRWTVLQVANRFGLSTRTLERAMVEARLPPVSVILRECIVDLAEELHSTTDCSWAAIASMLGIRSAQALLMLRMRAKRRTRLPIP